MINDSKLDNLVNESNHISVSSDPILISCTDLLTDTLTTTAANIEIKQLVKNMQDDLEIGLNGHDNKSMRTNNNTIKIGKQGKVAFLIKFQTLWWLG